MKDIITFKGFNTSWFKYLNLLQKEDNIYIMDNHLAALWCWVQELDFNKKYNFLHVDAHYDTLASKIDTWIEYLPKNFEKLNIVEYTEMQYFDSDFREGCEILRWDNYIPIFHRLYRDNINKYHFFTHEIGSLFNEMKDIVEEYSIYHVIDSLDYALNPEDYDWIVNIDIDYFFQKIEKSEKHIKFITKEVVEIFCEKIYNFLNAGKIKVLTFALSPECCGGWQNSIDMMQFIAEKLKLEFKI